MSEAHTSVSNGSDQPTSISHSMTGPFSTSPTNTCTVADEPIAPAVIASAHSGPQISNNLECMPSTAVDGPTSYAHVSANVSAKNADTPEHLPYGTRSRNRSGTRPNYAEDFEVEMDLLAPRNDTKYSKSSTSSVATPKMQTFPGVDTMNMSAFGGRQLLMANGLHSGGNDLSSVSGTPPERKKRKYQRHTHRSSPATDAKLMVRDTIPGTSQFFAVPGGMPDSAPPPPKKRKTIDGLHQTALKHATNQELLPKRHSLSHSGKISARDTCLVTFEKTGAKLENNKLKADDGCTYSVNDHVYLVCEPPGDPYYLCRIMEFRCAIPGDPRSPVSSLLVNWYFRPKDIGRSSIDPRFLYASMQSDECPITSLRGKCHIKHRSEIKDLEEYRKGRDTFWFNQLYDRYIRRSYEMIPTRLVVNVPENVKKALDERWKFIVVEPAKMKELTSAAKLCKRCSKYCAPNNSVDCGVCRNTYHMNCVQPPLAKKPSRGFAWSCGPCSRAQERKLEQRHTAIVEPGREEDLPEEEEEELSAVIPVNAPTKAEDAAAHLPVTEAETAQARLWLWRYLGIHCRVEDVLQYDDNAIYPRASSRLGTRHQAVIPPWYGQEVQLVKASEAKKKYAKWPQSKKEAKLSKETVAALEAEKIERANRPKWIQDEPEGYVARGEDLPNDDPNNTAQRLFAMPSEPIAKARSGFAAINAPSRSNDEIVEEYMFKARTLALKNGVGNLRIELGCTNENMRDLQKPKDPLGLLPTNFLDQALSLLEKSKFRADVALQQLANSLTSKQRKDPEFTKDELKKFEDGVAKYGSELRNVRKHVKTHSHADIVRFYYVWKWTPRGKAIWGRYGGRRGTKRRAETSWTDIADDEDDSAFDNDKAQSRKRQFQCNFCSTRSSRRWRRAPNIAPGATVPVDPKLGVKEKGNSLVVALCHRCAGLWRRYAIKWEDPEEIARSFNQQGGRAWKRKTDEELIRELVLANELAGVPTTTLAAAAASSLGIAVSLQQSQDHKKKTKEKNDFDQSSDPVAIDNKVKKIAPPPAPAPPPPPRPPTPPIIPQQPKMRVLPCAICRYLEPVEDQLVSCKDCKLTVHRQCYSIPEQASAQKWLCDTCLNDRSAQLPSVSHVSHNYKCVLCPVANREVDLIEPPKVSHKKKNDREREKERMEKELATAMVYNYRKQQADKGRPLDPREALKCTSNNNWMHVTCAIWTPEIKFADVEKMDRAEGVGALIASQSRLDQVCRICREAYGACASCHQCHTTFHVGCAHEAGYRFGFDVLPVKGSRKDAVQTVALGAETGSLVAAIWCPEHTVKTIVHEMNEPVGDSGLNALQLFVKTYKQADLTLTGTARKANLLGMTTKAVAHNVVLGSGSRRASLITNGFPVAGRGRKESPLSGIIKEETNDLSNGDSHDDRRCMECSTESSLKWYRTGQKHTGLEPSINGMNPTSNITPLMDGDVQKRQEGWQCHKCYVERKLGISPKPFRTDEDDSLSRPPPLPDLFKSARQPLTNGGVGPPAQPAPGMTWAADVSQSGMPLMPQPFGVPHRMEDVERWKEELHKLTVRLSNKSGKVHIFHGYELGDINDDPNPIFRFVVCIAKEKLGFDDEKHVIVNEGGITINGPAALMQVLTSQLMSFRREAHWQVLNLGEVSKHSGVFNGLPVPTSIMPQEVSPVAHLPQASQSNTLSTNALANGLRPPMPLSMSLPSGLNQPLSISQGVGSHYHVPSPMPLRVSPYFTPPQMVSPLTTSSGFAVKSLSATSPIGPGIHHNATKPTTPREQLAATSTNGGIIPGVPGSGASSSPNLRNLMH